MEVKTVYIIGHKGYAHNTYLPSISFYAGFTDNGQYASTDDITKAYRFASRKELFDFLDTYCSLRGSILFEFAERYLEYIKTKENIKRIWTDALRY